MSLNLFLALRNAASWAGFDLGRPDGASAQAVVLIDPVTGFAVTPGAQADRLLSTITIANAASVSGTIDLVGTALVGFVMPSAWTSAALNMDVSVDGSTWAAPNDSVAAAVSSFASPVAGAAYAVDALSLLPWRYVRFRSGTTGSPVNQGALRTFQYVTRPLS